MKNVEAKLPFLDYELNLTHEKGEVFSCTEERASYLEKIKFVTIVGEAEPVRKVTKRKASVKE